MNAADTRIACKQVGLRKKCNEHRKSTQRTQLTHRPNARRLFLRQLRFFASRCIWTTLVATNGWSSKLVVGTTLSRYCAYCTGFGCQNVFRSGWQCWCIAASTALHLATWPQIFSACHTSTHADDCALRLHQRWSFHAQCVLPLATAPFQRLLHRSNSLPESVRSSPSLQVFHSRLKTKLFARSYSHD